MSLLITFLFIVFVLSAIVLIVVILLQEGKGGGLGQALGGHGQATFGVGAQGINRFTGWTAVVFLVTALGIHWLNRRQQEALVGGGASEPAIESGVQPGGSGTGGGEEPPKG